MATMIDGYEIPWRPAVPPEDTKDMPPYVKQTRTDDVLPTGWKKSAGTRPLPCDILYQQNIDMRLRDGTKIYYDVFRSVSEKKVPALLSLSPYGKGGHGFLMFENLPFRMGVPESMTSGLEKFEGADPAEWIPRGYAVVNVDIRGSWESEGDIYCEGSQAGRDAYDVIEHIAALPWCTGAVSMQGNSWLATTQWAAALEHPPSLKCIAPWEGFNDFYRGLIMRGGVPNTSFINFIFDRTIRGRNRMEDLAGAAKKWPLVNSYWADKRRECSGIQIPMYVVASYSSSIHSFGTYEAYMDAKSKDKWLRIHTTQEWIDLYQPENVNDLQKFYDRYLKGINNDWEATPRVRASLLTYGDRAGPLPLENIPFTEYPPAPTEYKEFYLTGSNALQVEAPEDDSVVTYQSDDPSSKPADFAYTFSKTSSYVGFAKAKLYLSSTDADDMDVFITVRKLNKDGKLLEHVNIPWDRLPENVNTQEDVPNTGAMKVLGPSGVLRASHRAQDPKKSTDIIPFHPHDKEEKISPGTVTYVEIGLWPGGIHFQPGDSILVRVHGFADRFSDIPTHVSANTENVNKGKHTIHVGGKYKSSIRIPIVDITS